MERRLDLVDILPARAARARGTNLEVLLRDLGLRVGLGVGLGLGLGLGLGVGF